MKKGHTNVAVEITPLANNQRGNMKQALALNQNDQDLRHNLSNLTKKDLNNILRLIGKRVFGNPYTIDVLDERVNKVPKYYFITETFLQLSYIRDHNDHFEFPTTIQV